MSKDLETLIAFSRAATKGPYSWGDGNKIKGADGKTVARVSLGWRTSAQYKANLMFITDACNSAEDIATRLMKAEARIAALKKRDWRQMQQEEFQKVLGDPSKGVSLTQGE